MSNNGKKLRRFLCGLLSAMIIFVLMSEPVYAMEVDDSVLAEVSDRKSVV